MAKLDSSDLANIDDAKCYQHEEYDEKFKTNKNIWLPYILLCLYGIVQTPHLLWKKEFEGNLITYMVGEDGADRDAEVIAISFKFVRYIILMLLLNGSLSPRQQCTSTAPHWLAV